MNKILIVEDNTVNMKLFRDLLETRGYDITCAYDGEEGYSFLEKNEYDLVILDIQLPKLDGFGLLERAKKAELELPKIIIVSAFAMENEINLAKLYNIKKYITKPIDVVKFMDLIDNINKKGEI